MNKKKENKKVNNNKVMNFYDLKGVKKHMKKSNNPHFEQTQIKTPSRLLIIGATGAGKTNMILDYLKKVPKTFTKIIIVHKMDEALYSFLKDKIKDNLHFFKSIHDCPDPTELEKELEDDDQVLLIFDDQVNEKDQSKIKEYFLRGRKIKGGITIFYLAQSYYPIPIFVRQQASYLVLIKLNSKRDLTSILKGNSLSIDDVKQLKYMFNDATKEPFNFLKIDLASTDKNKIFSKNYNQFYQIPDSDSESSNTDDSDNDSSKK